MVHEWAPRSDICSQSVATVHLDVAELVAFKYPLAWVLSDSRICQCRPCPSVAAGWRSFVHKLSGSAMLMKQMCASWDWTN